MIDDIQFCGNGLRFPGIGPRPNFGLLLPAVNVAGLGVHFGTVSIGR